MLDTTVYLEKITLFGKLLRNEGIVISPKENADACSILAGLDMSDRPTVKTALRTVYAKSREDQIKFDKLFDAFFLSEDAIHAIDKKHQEQELEKARAMEEARRKLESADPNSEYSPEDQEAFAAMKPEDQDRLMKTVERYSNRRTEQGKLYNELIHTVFMKSIMEQQLMMEDAALAVAPMDPEEGLIFRQISDFKDNEIPKAVMYISNLASGINKELSRKNSSKGRSFIPEFKKTIRKGLETGGSFYKIIYKKPKKRRRQLVVLCDVSGSMLQFSEFALRFIQALNQTAENSRIFLFSETLAEADKFHLSNMNSFRDYVRETGLYGRGTDLGAALKELNDARPATLTQGTVLVILSDAKSVNMNSVQDELDRARSRAGKVYLLNPIPQSKWKYSSGIMKAAERCTMLSCSTLNELAAACRKL